MHSYMRSTIVLVVVALLSQTVGCTTASVRRIERHSIREDPGWRGTLGLTLETESDYPAAWKEKRLPCTFTRIVVKGDDYPTPGGAWIGLSSVYVKHEDLGERKWWPSSREPEVIARRCLYSSIMTSLVGGAEYPFAASLLRMFDPATV